MSTKLKALSLGLMALLAVTGFAAVNASATVKGHFTHDAETNHAKVRGVETVGTTHRLKFWEHTEDPEDIKQWIECTHAEYNGEVQAKTVQEVTVTPTYKECRTNNAPAGTHNVTVDVNDCAFILYSHGNNTHGTVTIECKGEKPYIEITHPNCNIRVPEQHPGETLEEGITYTTLFENEKHTLTADVTVTTITGHYESGICIFLGTNHKFNMTGSVTVEGLNTNDERVNITHTESP